MKKFFAVTIGIVLIAAACNKPVAVQPAPAPSPTPVTQNDLKTYTNAQYGFEFQYPKDWQFEATGTSFTDIHLSNIAVIDRADCSKFIGMEVQAALPFTGSFDSFVKTQVNGQGMGPSGNLVKTTIGGHTAYKVDQSGWDGGCGGPGYFIQVNSTEYIYIFSGRAKDTDQKSIDQILATFKFTK